jgi:hypothetical protein
MLPFSYLHVFTWLHYVYFKRDAQSLSQARQTGMAQDVIWRAFFVYTSKWGSEGENNHDVGFSEYYLRFTAPGPGPWKIT